MDGLDIIYSTVCNATFCDGGEENPYHDGIAPKKALENFVNGKHLRIGTFQNYPMSWSEKTENGSYIGRGVAFVIFEILQKKFNFTYDVVIPEGNLLHSEKTNEESLLGLLRNKKIDMAVAFVPILKNSDKMVTFSTVLDEGEWRMMLKRPKESAVGSGLLAPFDEYVWFLILVSVVLYGPCMTLLTGIRSKLMPDEERYVPLCPSVWFVYGAFIKQGTTLSPSANTTRVLFATWWLFIILLSAFYTANLTAFLTLSKFTLEVETVQDLYSKNYRWMAPEGSAVKYAVKNPEENIHFLYKSITDGRAKFLTLKYDQDYLEFVSDGAVLVQPKITLEHMMYMDYQKKTREGIPEAERCTYVLSPGVFMSMRRAFAYQHKSKLKPLFNSVIKKIIRSGIQEHISRRNLPDTKICPLDLQSKDRQLRVTDLLMTYYIMAVGMATAVAVFVGEISIRRYIFKRCCEKQKLRRNMRQVKPITIDESQPPPYESLFGKAKRGQTKKEMINGREYWVINKDNGETRLIPVRTPSALLYR
ncbi:unnamed protein product [Leptosia nina]|uniref:Ionotropic glutamate receptor C-terminal domain-containing protein n=1 Tax=Leptosia nina TaxID=320188 RepID=A0AAV1JUY3_9NEOP